MKRRKVIAPLAFGEHLRGNKIVHLVFGRDKTLKQVTRLLMKCAQRLVKGSGGAFPCRHLDRSEKGMTKSRVWCIR